MGISSDLGGSTRLPAFFNGIFGHKPSALIVSNGGSSSKQLSALNDFNMSKGPMCRFACDLKPILEILAGDKAKQLRLNDPVHLAHLKYFYQENNDDEFASTPVDYDVSVGIEKVLEHIRNAIGVTPTRVKIDALKDSTTLWVTNMIETTDPSMPFERALANFNGRIDPYVELLKWLVGKSKHTFAALSYCILWKCYPKLGSAKHKWATKQRDNLILAFDKLLGDDGVFIYPTHPTVAPYHNETIPRLNNVGFTGVFNVLGLPSTTVPLGIGPSERLPIGLQVVANRNQDRLCLAVASELERAFGGWVAPDISLHKKTHVILQ